MARDICARCQKWTTTTIQVVEKTIEKTVNVMIETNNVENPHVIFRHDENELGTIPDSDEKFLLTRPDLWPENVEVSFLRGVWGKRITGTICARKNEWTDVCVIEDETSLHILNVGGVWQPAGERPGDILQSINTNTWSGSACVYYNRQKEIPQIVFTSMSVNDRADCVYDIWVTYTAPESCTRCLQ